MTRVSLLTSFFIVVLGIAGCSTNDPNKRTKAGLAVGAVAGAVIGNQSSSRNGKYVGAVIGAISGAAAGAYMDRQQRKLEQKLAKERRDQRIKMVRVDDETIRLDLRSESSFALNSAALSANFRDSLDTMAEVINEFEKTAVHIIGHTDSSGSHNYNRRLSGQRAKSVYAYFVNQGIGKRRLRASGVGETQPRYNNNSESGRQLNRRVEVFLKTVVKGREAEAFRTPNALN
ncbi:MAG: OmpA family protein [Granulosicoccus sp.]|nr:OmpA family protein [Granulosicoccus sp.]